MYIGTPGRVRTSARVAARLLAMALSFLAAQRHEAAVGAEARPAPSPAVRRELNRTAALLRGQMARLPEGSGVVVVREPDRLIVRVPATLLFDPDMVELRATPDARVVLSVMVQPLRRRQRLHAQVSVYTDSIGGASFNETVSTERATALGEALRAAGAPSGRLQVRGAGATAALTDNDTPAGRIRNRRVEMVLEYQRAEAGAQVVKPTLKPVPATGHAGG